MAIKSKIFPTGITTLDRTRMDIHNNFTLKNKYFIRRQENVYNAVKNFFKFWFTQVTI